MQKKIALYRTLALAGYFGLLLLNLLWFTIISPAIHTPVALILIATLIPLLFPLKGLLHGKPYTYAWSSFLTFYYFFIAVDFAFNNIDDKLYGYIQLFFSVLMFIGCIFYARYATRASKTDNNPN